MPQITIATQGIIRDVSSHTPSENLESPTQLFVGNNRPLNGLKVRFHF